LVVPLAAVSALAMLGACVEFYSFEHPPDDYDAGTGGKDGGDGGTTGTCSANAECGMPTECGTPFCNDGKCDFMAVAEAGTMPTELENVYGDCKIMQCSGDGTIEVLENQNSDMYDYNNSCYVNDCSGGNAVPQTGHDCTKPGGIDGKCSAEGKCVECSSDTHCTNMGANTLCQRGRCVPMVLCTDLMTSTEETDQDCGGVCGPCDAGKLCDTALDCLSSVCKSAGVGQPKTCQEPSCSDGVQNGKETDQECGGGVCPTCGNGDTCIRPTDCTSDKCQAGICVP
jgi:hypothetical protein